MLYSLSTFLPTQGPPSFRFSKSLPRFLFLLPELPEGLRGFAFRISEPLPLSFSSLYCLAFLYWLLANQPWRLAFRFSHFGGAAAFSLLTLLLSYARASGFSLFAFRISEALPLSLFLLSYVCKGLWCFAFRFSHFGSASAFSIFTL